MKKRALLFFILMAVLASLTTCGKKEKSSFKPVPDKDLINILTDTYIADGLMNITRIRDMYRYRDSTINYTEVAGRYGYTLPQVDSTLKYYFIHKPKKLEKIYDAVTGKLLEMQTEVENSGTETADSDKITNLWNGKPSYSFPSGTSTDSIPFFISVKDKGIYTFRASYTIYPDDQSINPALVIRFSYFDGKGKETVENWDKCQLVKDGKPHIVELNKELPDNTNSSVNGFLLYQSNTGRGWKKHAIVTDIFLSVTPSGVQVTPAK